MTTRAATPAYPFPQHVTYVARSILPGLRSQAQLDDDVRAFYDLWKADFLKPVGTDAEGKTRYRIAFGKKGKKAERTVSEGQGYGMVIVALMAGHDSDARAIFDGLHSFALAFPSTRDARLMSWEVPVEKGADSAFDGDADIAYALLLAHAQWGSAGLVDYAAAARIRLAGVLASTIGPQSRLPMLGDWVDADGAKANQYTPRSSDLMPGHFRAWARFTDDPAWHTVASSSADVINVLQAKFSPQTGLLPDFIVDTNTSLRPAPAKFLEGMQDDDYYYNAGRVPWRLAVDALLHGDATSVAQARRICAWALKATGGNPRKLCAGYHLDGTPLAGSEYFSSFFAAPIGVAAMLDAGNPAWLDALYGCVRATHEDYYEDSVTLQCLLVMSGNLWDPTLVALSAPTKPAALRK